MRPYRRSLPYALAFLALVLAACSPATAPAGGAGSIANGGGTAAVSAPKQLTLGILEEPKGWAPWIDLSSGGGAYESRYLVLATLTVRDDQDQIAPVLAPSVPSLDQGDWRINPDGTMDQTWRLRPNLTWHDGQPLSAEDFVFGWQVATDPDLPNPASLARQYIDSASAPDPQTLQLHFSSTTPTADSALFYPLPRHLLADHLAQDLTQFPDLDYWTTGQIAAGPYRLTGWVPGAYQEYAAFDGYALGRPHIDTVRLRFLQDSNTLLANILAGEVDVALPQTVSLDMAAQLEGSWATPDSGNQVILYPDGQLYFMSFQNRAEYAKPSAALDPRLRQAFYETIDKDAVNTAGMTGVAVLADSWIPPDDPRHAVVADSIPPWSFDLAQAQRMLDDAGWQRGPDGILVNRGTGERMETDIRVTGVKGHVNELAVMADNWRKVGATVSETVIPAPLLADLQYRATFPFVEHTGARVDLAWEFNNMACTRAARPETRWGGNRNGYCNPTADPLIQQLQTTIPIDQRARLQEQIMAITLKQDLVELPLYWSVTPYTVAKGITGPGVLHGGIHGGSDPPWNIQVWDRV